jgi:hypothetical protein
LQPIRIWPPLAKPQDVYIKELAVKQINKQKFKILSIAARIAVALITTCFVAGCQNAALKRKKTRGGKPQAYHPIILITISYLKK